MVDRSDWSTRWIRTCNADHAIRPLVRSSLSQSARTTPGLNFFDDVIPSVVEGSRVLKRSDLQEGSLNEFNSRNRYLRSPRLKSDVPFPTLALSRRIPDRRRHRDRTQRLSPCPE